jgi:hypothetical protein
VKWTVLNGCQSSLFFMILKDKLNLKKSDTKKKIVNRLRIPSRKKKHIIRTRAHVWVGDVCKRFDQSRPRSRHKRPLCHGLCDSALILIAICAQFLCGAHPPSNRTKRKMCAPKSSAPDLCCLWSCDKPSQQHLTKCGICCYIAMHV